MSGTNSKTAVIETVAHLDHKNRKAFTFCLIRTATLKLSTNVQNQHLNNILFCEWQNHLSCLFLKTRWKGCYLFVVENTVVITLSSYFFHKQLQSKHFRQYRNGCPEVFLEISQNSQENTCDRPKPAALLKTCLWLRYSFSCEFCEISKNTLLQNTSERLLLASDINISERSVEVFLAWI